MTRWPKGSVGVSVSTLPSMSWVSVVTLSRRIRAVLLHVLEERYEFDPSSRATGRMPPVALRSRVPMYPIFLNLWSSSAVVSHRRRTSLPSCRLSSIRSFPVSVSFLLRPAAQFGRHRSSIRPSPSLRARGCEGVSLPFPPWCPRCGTRRHCDAPRRRRNCRRRQRPRRPCPAC